MAGVTKTTTGREADKTEKMKSAENRMITAFSALLFFTIILRPIINIM